MLIQTRFTANDELMLAAYSHDDRELDDLRETVKQAGIRDDAEALDDDANGRPGIGYQLTYDKVMRLEQVLGGRFLPSGTFVSTLARTGSSYRYACREITVYGTGPGCESILAGSPGLATVVCATTASRKGWFGGNAALGSCP
ncbi:hypothetical protein [Tahibacter amnicola]|uniref:Uncharacterized protein n=1 Tax=Tahibacter amnicola TaxID=2976241 RepID=A0ABY6BJX6_9GAMM|nr:hypothetical protein [Tahibacter amnicola]UXI69772.1 hypothetical protein N4264_09115 [Tahibacter amnicola]